MYMDKCEVCSGEAIDTHHIAEQHTADENGIIEHYHKNNKFNLVALCKDCHHNVHHGNLNIEGYQMTSSGIKLNYSYKKTTLEPEHELGQEPDPEHDISTGNSPTVHDNDISTDPAGTCPVEMDIPMAEPVSPIKSDPTLILISGNTNRKKFNKAKRDIILSYKDNFNTYKSLISTLFTEHNIKIGQVTLKKIMDNKY